MKQKAKNKRVLIYDEDGLKQLALKLKEIRAKRKYTQEDLAYESGLSLSQIARIETCKINPTVSTIFKIVRTLKVDLKEIFDFKLK